MHNGLWRSVLLGAAMAMGASLLPLEASAQTAAGFRGGLRLTGLDTGQDADGISTFVVGGYFGLGLSDRVALQLEIVYGERGAESVGIGDGTLDPDAPPSDLSMQYLDVPVLLRAGFPGERFLPSFFIGPYAGFMLGCELTPEGEATRDCDTDGATARFDPRSTDFGMLTGAALDMAMGDSTLFIDVRYAIGLLALGSGDSGVDARHNGLEISGGFAFPLGR